MASIKNGLNLSKNIKTGPNKPAPPKRKPVFSADESDDEDVVHSKEAYGVQEITDFDLDVAPTPQASITQSRYPLASVNKPVLKTKLPLSDQTQSLSSLRSTSKTTNDVDPSIYDYDTFHSASAAVQRARKEEAAKNPQNGTDYMTDLMAAAEQRKKDQLRAKDRLLQKEREQEGDEFKDKDMFVTDAYKAQQAEARKLEEVEKLKEEEQERKKKELGMSAFHRTMMDEQDKRHNEALEAEKNLKDTGGISEADAEQAAKEKSDKQLAEELAQQGRKVELNEEGLVTDKRDLLSGGLNVVAKPKPASTLSAEREAAAQRRAAQQGYRPNMDARQAQRERQTRMMEAQLEAAAKRKVEDDAEEVQKRERAAKSQKTQGDISSAKERYLQRKREAAAEKATDAG